MKHTVDYYTKLGSHILCDYQFDISKAFSRVNYWKLFNKMLDDGVSCDVVRRISFCYSHHEVHVHWHNNISGRFGINNGTRQGGMLSPYLFSQYIVMFCIVLFIVMLAVILVVA